MQTADAVVIGAGVNGASTAYELVKQGLKKVILVEKHVLASGGTGKSAAFIRQHYSNEELARLVKRSVDVFHHFDEEVGGNPGFVNCGWAFLIPESVSDKFSENLEMQKRVGIDTREISKQELREMDPRINLDDVHRIAYEKTSGYADPHDTTYCYVQRFKEKGGTLMQMTEVLEFTIKGSAVKTVRTSRGDISTGIVVNAAGPWAHLVGKKAGLDIPIVVTREEEIILESVDAGGPPKMAFSDMALAIYYRPDGRSRTLLGRGFPKEYEYVDPNQYQEKADTKFIEETSSRFVQRFPSFEVALFLNAYVGLYDVTPDWHPILGEVRELKGFYMCAGFSGHGFKTAPAIGECLAEEILHGKSKTVDLSKFNLSRFHDNQQFTFAYGGNRA